MKFPAVTAIILAGGQGRRVDGADKGLLLHQNKPLVQHISESLRQCCDEIIISCNRNVDRYADFSDLCVGDDLPDFQGPLSGIYSAARRARNDWIFVCPCDTPNLSPSLVNDMQYNVDQSAQTLCVAHDGQRLQNLVMLGKKTCFDTIESFLTGQQRAVKHWIQQQQHSICYVADPQIFKNFNHLTDFTHD